MLEISKDTIKNNHEASRFSDKRIPATFNRTCMESLTDNNIDKKKHRFDKKIDMICQSCLHERMVMYFGFASKIYPCIHQFKHASTSKDRLKQCTKHREPTADNLFASQSPEYQTTHISGMSKEKLSNCTHAFQPMNLYLNKPETIKILFNKNTLVYNNKMNTLININIREDIDSPLLARTTLDITASNSVNESKLGYATIQVSHPAAGNSIDLKLIEVYPEYRKCNIGKIIINTIVNIAISNNIPAIYTQIESFGDHPTTSHALKIFYNKQGFTTHKMGFGVYKGVLTINKYGHVLFPKPALPYPNNFKHVLNWLYNPSN